MEEGVNISKPEILFSIAEQMEDDDFDFGQFKKDWQMGKGKDLFRADLQKARFNNIGRFPTLTFQNEKGKGIMIVGYRPFEVLHQAFMQVLDTPQ
jgi:predicted DsbA family dithiol-disulfide isomerase